MSDQSARPILTSWFYRKWRSQTRLRRGSVVEIECLSVCGDWRGTLGSIIIPHQWNWHDKTGEISAFWDLSGVDYYQSIIMGYSGFRPMEYILD
jgi:hypothetical protein